MTVQAVREVSLQVPAGEFLAVRGRSGSGKTTLLNLIAGLDRPDAGEVRVLGEPISAYTARPLGAGPFPGIVLIHHLPGWDEWYREATRKFAHHGYAAISHNLYHRSG